MRSPAALVRKALQRHGLEIHRIIPNESDAEIAATIAAVAPYTMTSPGRIAAVCDAVRYVTRYGVEGSFVECGVWRGGSALAAARTFLEVGETDRDLYLFDTFTGMTEPTDLDRNLLGTSAAHRLATSSKDAPIWAIASFEEVQSNLARCAYPTERVHLVRGPVEETVPDQAPDRIAVLRLDTDWYESTRHELEHLIDRVSDYGVLIIDDYGHWEGAKRAVDEWLATFDRPVLLSRSDYSGRTAVLGPRPS